MTRTSRQALVSTNGIWTNGLSTNGIWTNGIWTNGIWTNGIWTNGIWTNGIWTNGVSSNGIWTNGIWTNGVSGNGIWTNGIWTNGIWTNGIWTNGIWTNGIWTNGIWTNGIWTNGIWTNGLAGDTLRSNRYTRQLLQYVYACAMPAAVFPADGSTPTSYDTTLDPNSGNLACAADHTCDVGYSCSADNTCVIPLTGAIGLGINSDGSTWWGSGTCDESCQRWVSACVLARTNAYGVHVNISMRAPADAPQAIKDALAVSNVERNGDATHAAYSLREGAYYGNIFGTTPGSLDATGKFVPSTNGTVGTTASVIMQTPAFYACAGPGSNIPEVTKRFCSSQGDQSVINVPGVCLGTSTESGSCAGADTDPTSLTYGAIQDCYTNTDKSGTAYKEVITVFLQEPITLCDNGVCEAGESDPSKPLCGTSAGASPCYCPSDCHPGTWAHTFDSYILNGTISGFDGLPFEMRRNSAVGSDGTVVMAGTSFNDVNLGCGVAPSHGGQDYDVVVKYDHDGVCKWTKRFPGASSISGIAIASDNTIALAGWIAGQNRVWLARLDQNGNFVNGWPVAFGGASSVNGEIAVAVDGSGNVIAGTQYGTSATIGSHQLPGSSGNVIVKVPSNGLPSGADVAWVVPTSGLTMALATDPSGNVAAAVGLPYAGQASHPTGVYFFDASDGHVPWSHDYAGLASPMAVAVDRSGAVYVSGYGAIDFGGGVTFLQTNQSLFVVKYDNGGTYKWDSHPKSLCTGPVHSAFDCVSNGYQLAFDSSDNLLVGGAFLGNGADFGLGSYDSYHFSDLFVASYDTADTLPANAQRLLWSKHIPIVLSGMMLGMGVDPEGRVVTSGIYAGSMEPDDTFLVSTIPEDSTRNQMFVASFHEPPASDATAPDVGAATDQTGTPIDTVPNDIFAEATSSAGAVVFFMPPTATDDSYAGTSVACSPPPNSTFPIGVTTVTCTASDPLGNSSSATFTVTVADTLDPLISRVPTVPEFQATGPGGATVTYTPPIATDQVDGNRPVTCSPASGSTFPVGDTTVSCTATDTHGNSSSVTFPVSVVDTKPPVFPVLPNITAEATGPDGAIVSFAVSATDLVDGIEPASCSPAPGSTFAIGTTTVTCTATDTRQNTATKAFNVVVADTKPPVLTVPSDLTVMATNPSGAVVAFSASATDAVDGNVPVSCSPPSGSTFAIGAKPVTCTASDTRGHASSATFTITVVGTPPKLTVPQNITAEATGANGAAVTFTASATDMLDGNVPVTCSPPSGSTFAIGSTAVTCSASNTIGMTSSATFTVTVVDTTPPTLSLPGVITATATGGSGTIVTYTASATDLVDGSVAPLCTPASGSAFALGSTTVNCTATDAHGNSRTDSFTVQVQYSWSGILQPINPDGNSIFKLGRTVPVQFQLTGDSSGITNAVATLTVAKITSQVTGTDVEAVSTSAATSGNLFRYDPTSGEYIFNLDTKGLSQGTWLLTVDLHDGVARTITISLR